MTLWKVALGILAIASAGNAQGFGGSQCKIGIERLRPSPLMMRGPIEVSVSMGGDVDAATVDDAEKQIKQLLLAGDPSLNRSGETPGTQIDVKADLQTTVQVRTRMIPQSITRTIIVYNPQTKQNEEQIVIEVIEVASNESTVDGQLTVSWTARDPVTQRLISSGQTGAFSTRGNVQPEIEALRDAAAVVRNQLSYFFPETARKSIASSLEPAPETVTVLLAKAKSDAGCKLAKTGDWESALSFFEGLPPASNPKDESYRIYNIGVAEEALAYQVQPDGLFQSSLDHLNRATQSFADARARNAGEKVFAASQKRIEASLGYNTALQKHKKDNEDVASSPSETRSRTPRP